jgi:hypothetical protein
VDWLIIIAALVLPVAVGVAAYLRGRGTSADAPPLSPPPVEPSFNNNKSNEDDSQSQNPPQPQLPEIDADEWRRNFTPPDLPPPDEEVLRADVHYVAYIYGGEKTAPARMKPLSESLARGRLLAQRWLGFSDAGVWEEARGAKEYRHWIWAAPLANRAGRLDDGQMDSIERAIEHFAFASGMHPVFPKRAAVRESARLLDKFCEEVDEIVNIYALAAEGESQPAAQVAVLAEAEGFVRLRGGELAYFSDNQKLFSLKTRAGGDIGAARGLSGVRFVLDLPNVSRPAEAFDRMAKIAAKMARALHFTLAAEDGEPLAADAISAIRSRIEALRAKMDAYGVSAGGALARALFS